MLVRNKPAEPTAIGLAPNRALAENAKHFTSQPAKHFSSQSFCWQGFWRNHRQSYWCNPLNPSWRSDIYIYILVAIFVLWLVPVTPWHTHTTAPRRPGAPAHSSPTTGPSFKTLSETRHNFLGGIGLQGLGHVAFVCAADTTKLVTPGTCGYIFAAALLLPNQGQTNTLDPITTQEKGDGFG